ncbi:MAG: aminopeptidase P family N-terminal domain-containing protein [Acidobacteria bacterium]|nr:aminopeptidase P family N-terminal domain-containing protein [Acidobacteriota bacterium]
MASTKRAVLVRDLPWPDYGPPGEYVPAASAAELEANLERLRAAMRDRGLTHALVYGDREHFGNLHYLTGFDPRFEEALLVLKAGDDNTPLILVGNECQAYLAISPLRLRVERYQYFSLLDQPREASRPLQDILRGEGIDNSSKVGCIGWKYYAEPSQIDLPAYIVDAIGGTSKINATDLLMHPGYGLRTRANAREIAFSEYTNGLAATGMANLLRATQVGASEFDLLSKAGYNGLPQSCYWGLKTGPKRVSLSSPRGLTVEHGYPISANIAYWSANCCRAGWSVASETELPSNVSGYVTDFAAPYVEACGAWLEALAPGAGGNMLHQIVADRLPFESFGVYLNAGHLIHNEEWLSSPVYAGSSLALRSGMLLQSDIIPGSKTYGSSMRMEDTYAVADEALLAGIEAEYPDCYKRSNSRREFLRDVLGIELQRGILPLSNLAGLVTPFWLRPETSFALVR